MLRIGFLPSDFNPMLLMLGEPEDLRALGGVLRKFARDGGSVRLDELAFCSTSAVNLTLAAGTPAGVFPPTETDRRFVWRIDPEQATAFAGMADLLAEPGRIAGSELLECGIAEGIAVKLSRGEYTDDFLLPAT
ncbi:MAG TPA: hypothetical protein VND19_14045 [Acetobacteraceae bacterium]|nr:hypothetical protein [Acetobacteraceae bacterium]